MPHRLSDPDTRRLLHVAAWMWLGYLLALGGIDAFMYAKDPRNMPWVYYLGNGAVALVFMGFSYWPGLQRAAGRYYVPLMLFIISGLPIAASHVMTPFLPFEPMFNVEGITLKLLPILFIGLVMTAWQYSWLYVIGFALGTAGLQIALLLAFPPVEMSAGHAALFVTLVRSASFLVVGYFISSLMGRLRAQQDALAQTNAQLADYANTLERLTVSRERNRLARELHDTLAHTLSGLTVQLETTKAYWGVDPEMAHTLLEQSLASTRQGLDETRRALKALRASPLDDLGLLLAIRRLSETAAERGKLSLDLALPEHIPGLPPNVEQCIYRVAQEAIENVVHHANAQKLTVSLAVNGGGILLTVRDDGLGLDVGQAEQSGHFGLAGMRERAQLAGGELMIDSQPAQGVIVRLKI